MTLEQLIELSTGRFKLPEPSDHGLTHWEQVWTNCQILAEQDDRIDLEVCRMFAFCHDMERESESEDYDHGPRAAAYLHANPHHLRHLTTFNQITQLLGAIHDHTKGHLTDCPTIGACWDADRLDLGRVHIIPRPEYMSTEMGKRLCVG